MNHVRDLEFRWSHWLFATILVVVLTCSQAVEAVCYGLTANASLIDCSVECCGSSGCTCGNPSNDYTLFLNTCSYYKCAAKAVRDNLCQTDSYFTSTYLSVAANETKCLQRSTDYQCSWEEFHSVALCLQNLTCQQSKINMCTPYCYAQIIECYQKNDCSVYSKSQDTGYKFCAGYMQDQASLCDACVLPRPDNREFATPVPDSALDTPCVLHQRRCTAALNYLSTPISEDAGREKVPIMLIVAIALVTLGVSATIILVTVCVINRKRGNLVLQAQSSDPADQKRPSKLEDGAGESSDEETAAPATRSRAQTNKKLLMQAAHSKRQLERHLSGAGSTGSGGGGREVWTVASEANTSPTGSFGAAESSVIHPSPTPLSERGKQHPTGRMSPSGYSVAPGGHQRNVSGGGASDRGVRSASGSMSTPQTKGQRYKQQHRLQLEASAAHGVSAKAYLTSVASHDEENEIPLGTPMAYSNNTPEGKSSSHSHYKARLTRTPSAGALSEGGSVATTPAMARVAPSSGVRGSHNKSPQSSSGGGRTPLARTPTVHTPASMKAERRELASQARQTTLVNEPVNSVPNNVELVDEIDSMTVDQQYEWEVSRLDVEESGSNKIKKKATPNKSGGPGSERAGSAKGSANISRMTSYSSHNPAGMMLVDQDELEGDGLHMTIGELVSSHGAQSGATILDQDLMQDEDYTFGGSAGRSGHSPESAVGPPLLLAPQGATLRSPQTTSGRRPLEEQSPGGDVVYISGALDGMELSASNSPNNANLHYLTTAPPPPAVGEGGEGETVIVLQEEEILEEVEEVDEEEEFDEEEEEEEDAEFGELSESSDITDDGLRAALGQGNDMEIEECSSDDGGGVEHSHKPEAPVYGGSKHKHIPTEMADKDIVRHLKMNCWQRTRFLGQGSAGKVYLTTLPNGFELALKEIDLSGLSEADISAVLASHKKHKMLRHPQLVSTHAIGYDADKQQLQVWMENMKGPSLQQLASRHGNANPLGQQQLLLWSQGKIKQDNPNSVNSIKAVVPERSVAYFVKQLLEGLQYLHMQGVAHRDVKGSNVMLTQDLKVAKLVDFGTASGLERIRASSPNPGQQKEDSPHGSFDVDSANDGKSISGTPAVGTPQWMAPELIDDFVQKSGDANTASGGSGRNSLVTGSSPFAPPAVTGGAVKPPLHNTQRPGSPGVPQRPTTAKARKAQRLKAKLAADIWAVGITTAELLLGGQPPYPPFESNWAAVFAIGSGTVHPMLPKANASPELTDFFECCLARNPMERSSVGELLLHPWFAQQADPSTKEGSNSVKPKPRARPPSATNVKFL